jgi:hypothetical protein
MSVKIEGVYQTTSDENGVVYISRLSVTSNRTLYSRTGTLPNIPALTQEYRVEMKNTWEGLAVFDGRRLLGQFQPKNFPPQSLEELRSQPMLFGQFEAHLRADGSFAVVIEQWDGNRSWRGDDSGQLEMTEPELMRVEAEWVPSSN